jgi:uncharacterized protein
MSDGFESIGVRAPLSLTPGGYFQAGGVPRKGALLVSSTELFAWTSSGLPGEDDILRFVGDLSGARGDFLLLGTGAFLKFPSPPFRAGIDRLGMGLEIMDTGAACRTYNVLVAEARMFTAALLPLADRPPSS